MRIGIMVSSLVAHDAVGNDALGMYLAFVREGYEAYLFTHDGKAASPLPVHHYADAPLLLSSDDLIIYHLCVSDPPGLHALRHVQCRIVIKYHNITPASYFAEHSLAFARAAREGREALADFAELPLTAVMGDSDYNTAELSALTDPAVLKFTVPPLHRIDELISQPDEQSTQDLLGGHWFNILTVGRVVPNKNLDAMLETLAILIKDFQPNLHLHIVGGRDPRMSSYHMRLDAIIKRRALDRAVTWHDNVTPQKLATLYRRCDLFWTASRHEGFCVPAIEAMAFKRPVLSSRKAALPETCGEASAYADTADECVQAIRRLAEDDQARIALGRAGRRRFDLHYRNVRIVQRLLEAVANLQSHAVQRVAATTLAHDGYWFNLPDAEGLISEALSAAGPLEPLALAGLERRRSFVDWILREGWHRSEKVSARLRSHEFLHFAEGIPIGGDDVQLSPAMRLRWLFDRAAQARFNTDSPGDVAEFIRWYNRNGGDTYGVLAA